MSDIIDVANAQAELILNKQIELQRGKPLDIFPNKSEKCWECATPVSDGRRWCSKECARVAEKKSW